MRDARTRIAERTRIADLQLRGQGWFGRVANRIGLFIANTTDQLTAFADNDRTVFLGATAAGLLRGAVYGVLVTIFAAALFPLGGAAIPLLFTLMAVGAVGYGIYDGQRGLEHHLTQGDPKLSDTIAQKLGAVPGKTIHATKKPDRVPEKQIETTSFVEREDARRSEAAAAAIAASHTP